MIDDFLRLSVLFDFYGALLTDKQQECLRMHLYQDWSLSEIAAALNISRQAAYDMIHRCEITLEKYENKLRLIEKHDALQNALKDILSDIDLLKTDYRSEKVRDVDRKINTLLETR